MHRNATGSIIDNVCLLIRDSERIKASMRSLRNSPYQTFPFAFINVDSGTLKIK